MTRLANIMRRAHEIARTLEGDYSARLAMGLRRAWAEVKLAELGSVWQKAGHHRIYFNRLTEWYGLELEYYKTGNIRHALHNGCTISNRSARGICYGLMDAKIWYDVITGQFAGKGVKREHYEIIVANIKAAARIA